MRWRQGNNSGHKIEMDTVASVEPSSTTGMTVAQLLNQSRKLLASAGIEMAALEASWLLEEALQTTALKLAVERNRILTPSERHQAETLIARRAAREPLQYILRSQEFCGLDFEVSCAVLIPRPETELLVEETKQALIGRDRATVVDIGTGSGCLAVTLATLVPSACVYAVDSSAAALSVAERNIARHSVEGRVICLQGDLCSPLSALGLAGQVDVIVSNPPYIAESEWSALQPEVRDFEPRRALVAGEGGVEVHRRLLEQAWKFLAPGGWLFMEIGKGQSEAIRRLAVRTGRYREPSVRRDAAGIDRVVRVQSRR
ncbi:MAG TPA: peptide chain release factor N(5)-glutamine methyltransferase [Nitrospiraceae bacterium]|nr:peptide chain release factor N(5)-glutamine methyltransferase [Nitrospiraceae bacterium]